MPSVHFTYNERHCINHNPEAIINDTSTLNRCKIKGEKNSPAACCMMPNLICVTCYVFKLCIYVEFNSLLALRPMYYYSCSAKVWYVMRNAYGKRASEVRRKKRKKKS